MSPNVFTLHIFKAEPPTFCWELLWLHSPFPPTNCTPFTYGFTIRYHSTNFKSSIRGYNKGSLYLFNPSSKICLKPTSVFSALPWARPLPSLAGSITVAFWLISLKQNYKSYSVFLVVSFLFFKKYIYVSFPHQKYSIVPYKLQHKTLQLLISSTSTCTLNNAQSPKTPVGTRLKSTTHFFLSTSLGLSSSVQEVIITNSSWCNSGAVTPLTRQIYGHLPLFSLGSPW